MYLALGSLWRSSGERNEKVLVPRNLGYIMILAPSKQTRIIDLFEEEVCRTFLKILQLVLSGSMHHTRVSQIAMAKKLPRSERQSNSVSCMKEDSLGRL